MMWKEALTQKCDIFCTQETHLRSDLPPKVSHPKFPHCIFANADKKKQKQSVLIVIRDTVVCTQQFLEIDPNGQFIILGALLNHRPYTIVTIYAPNNKQKPFLIKLMKKVLSLHTGRLILCGDFNEVPDSSLDSTNCNRHPSRTLHE